jgi:hypothetical protein
MRTIHAALFCACLIFGSSAAFAESASKHSFSFGVIAHNVDVNSDQSTLAEDLSASDRENLAFVVVNGIKAGKEACTDEIYHDRLRLMDNAQNGLILSLTADDWASCVNNRGKSAAIERLNRVRELFFSEKFSLGGSRIPVIRQSLTPKFRSYAENTRWIFRNVLFVTINLPENNNNYLPEAGRNSEFEDRLIATEDWLQKVFTFAERRKLNGIVLFSDGNPLNAPSDESLAMLKGKRDGFQEVRKQLTRLASGFQGQILIVHRQAPAKSQTHTGISWHRNLGQMGIKSGWVKMNVSGTQPIFSIDADFAPQKDMP